MESLSLEIVKAKGQIPIHSYRVVVLEANDKISTRDFSDFDLEKMYADDAASEVEYGPVFSTVYDWNFILMYKGRHY